jgi:hypothetical protein
MGNWHISIKGVGIHHNGRKDDAEQMAADFVDELKKAGHSVTHAEMTHGGSLDLADRKALCTIKDETTKP